MCFNEEAPRRRLVDNQLYERRRRVDLILITLGIVAIVAAAATLLWIGLHPVPEIIVP